MSEEKLKQIAIFLNEIEALKFGEFITKVGLKSPVYLDLRVIMSYPAFLQKITLLLWNSCADVVKFDQICGVPYTALPMATLISVYASLPMVIRRKEAKAYGTKKLLEGDFDPGHNCVIIEDIVTSGSSILETARDLRNAGLVVTNAYVILDREQGGKENLRKSGIIMKSLFTLTQFINILAEAGHIGYGECRRVKEYLQECNAPVIQAIEKEDKTKRLKLDFSSRADLSQQKNPMASKIFELMQTKSTTICLAADFTKSQDILELADLAGPHIAILKTHVDIIEDFDQSFIERLKQLAKKHNFLIMEDRKFADIGNTVKLQYSKGIYHICDWADLVTVHTTAGPGIISAIEEALKGKSELRGIFLITEMSSKGALTKENYAQESVTIGNESKLVVGHVCQSNVFYDPCLIQLTPGVKLEESSDDLDQQYNTPQSVVSAGADLAVVGRGITEAADKLAAILKYKNQLWTAYESRVHG